MNTDHDQTERAAVRAPSKVLLVCFKVIYLANTFENLTFSGLFFCSPAQCLFRTPNMN